MRGQLECGRAAGGPARDNTSVLPAAREARVARPLLRGVLCGNQPELCYRRSSTAAWAYDRLPAFDDDAICAEHARAAEENNARIAPVGAARTAGPEGLDLFDDDREHPSLAGTYLAACVIAATIYGAEARQAPKRLPAEEPSAGAAVMLPTRRPVPAVWCVRV